VKLITVVAVALASSAQAQTVNYLNYKMVSTAGEPFKYSVDGRNQMPMGLTLGGVQTAVNSAWNTWNAVACAAPKVQPLGFSNDVSAYDKFSTTPIFILSDADPDLLNTTGLYVGAITIPTAFAGVLEQCDIFFNGAKLQWSINGMTPADRLDVETVMLHEAGHCLGLGHFGDSNSVMNFFVERGRQLRAFGGSEVQALCQQNPVSGAAGAPCLTDGTCGGTPGLKCLPQPTTNGLNLKRCTVGCTFGTGGGCDKPTVCQSSNDFLPTFSGACKLPGTTVTQVGKTCTNPAECGAAMSECQGDQIATSGGSNARWGDGYCFQRCEAAQAECPAGALCVNMLTSPIDLGVSLDERRCLQTCRLGLADCRPQYACVETTGTNPGVCIPKCYADSDCVDPQNHTCRTCDGVCVSKQNLNGKIGDVCDTDDLCGTGQVCKKATSYSATKQCTSSCGRGCGVCPANSVCAPLATGELDCLLSCTGPGTCPMGLRCADTPAGRACLPVCTIINDCPVGQQCGSDGECSTPNVNPCTGVLCMNIDAGKPIAPTGRDGGTQGGGSVGCGCNSVGGSAIFMLGFLLALAMLKRKQ
jgi:hypothetical protein